MEHLTVYKACWYVPSQHYCHCSIAAMSPMTRLGVRDQCSFPKLCKYWGENNEENLPFFLFLSFFFSSQHAD